MKSSRWTIFWPVLWIVFWLVLAISACGKRADVDPRDEAGVRAGKNQCDRTSPGAQLKVDNQSTFSVRVHVVRAGGGRWTLHPTVHGLSTTYLKVSRQFLDSAGYILLEITGGGLVVQKPGPVYLAPLACDVGTLFIAPSPSMSSYVGADM